MAVFDQIVSLMENAIERLGHTLNRIVMLRIVRFVKMATIQIFQYTNLSQLLIEAHQTYSKSSRNPEKTESRNKDLDKLISRLRATSTAKSTVEVILCQNGLIFLQEGEKGAEEELWPVISNQLAEVAQKYWTDESKKSQVVNNIADGLKISSNCHNIRVQVK